MAKKKNYRRKPSQSRSIDTVNAICVAAVQVFERLGYAVTTTSKIAERAGVSVGSLYQYFSSKDAILLELWRRHAQEAHAELHVLLDDPSVIHASVAELAERLCRALIQLHLCRPKLHRVFSERGAGKRALFEAKKREDRALLEKAARLFSKHPKIRAADPSRTALIVGQLLESFSHWYVLDSPPLGEAEFVGELSKLLEAYLLRAKVAV